MHLAQSWKLRVAQARNFWEVWEGLKMARNSRVWKQQS